MEGTKGSELLHSVEVFNSSNQKFQPTHALTQYPKWFGGSASVFSVCFSHPLDLIKVRHQTATASKQSIITIVRVVMNTEGIRGLYRGLSASMLRQLTYGSTRFAIYEVLKDKESSRRGNGPLPISFLMSASTFSGACGAVVGNPADIANVRMQNDKSLAPNLRQNYRGVFDVLTRIIREEGLKGFTRGILPNAIRSGCMTGCQLGSYDWFKNILQRHVHWVSKDGMVIQFSASILAGLVASTICNPIDVIKTRIMSVNSKRTSVIEIVRELTRTDGLRWMLRGWMPSFTRLGPHTVATLLLLEQHKRLYRQFTGREEQKQTEH